VYLQFYHVVNAWSKVRLSGEIINSSGKISQ